MTALFSSSVVGTLYKTLKGQNLNSKVIRLPICVTKAIFHSVYGRTWIFIRFKIDFKTLPMRPVLFNMKEIKNDLIKYQVNQH